MRRWESENYTRCSGCCRVQSKDQVVVVIDPERCKEPDHSLRIIPVALYLVDDFGSYDKTLIDEMKKLLEEEGANNYSLPVSLARRSFLAQERFRSEVLI